MEFQYVEWKAGGLYHIHVFGHDLRFIVAAPTPGIARVEVLAQVCELIREGILSGQLRPAEFF